MIFLYPLEILLVFKVLLNSVVKQSITLFTKTLVSMGIQAGSTALFFIMADMLHFYAGRVIDHSLIFVGCKS